MTEAPVQSLEESFPLLESGDDALGAGMPIDQEGGVGEPSETGDQPAGGDGETVIGE